MRQLYGVPGAREMEAELGFWIDQSPPKPQRTGELAPWPPEAALPPRFEPDAVDDRAGYEALRAADLPLFCYGEAPRTQTCVMLVAPLEVVRIGRRLLE